VRGEAGDDAAASAAEIEQRGPVHLSVDGRIAAGPASGPAADLPDFRIGRVGQELALDADAELLAVLDDVAGIEGAHGDRAADAAQPGAVRRPLLDADAADEVWIDVAAPAHALIAAIDRCLIHGSVHRHRHAV